MSIFNSLGKNFPRSEREEKSNYYHFYDILSSLVDSVGKQAYIKIDEDKIVSTMASAIVAFQDSGEVPDFLDVTTDEFREWMQENSIAASAVLTALYDTMNYHHRERDLYEFRISPGDFHKYANEYLKLHGDQTFESIVATYFDQEQVDVIYELMGLDAPERSDEPEMDDDDIPARRYAYTYNVPNHLRNATDDYDDDDIETINNALNELNLTRKRY